jgi:CHAT domain-containing protein
MGLRASIAASGARSVIMSLWKVPDESTSRLMQAFYTNLWQKKMRPSVALQQAQQSIREDPSGRFRAPVHWAGWVLAGEGW